MASGFGGSARPLIAALAWGLAGIAGAGGSNYGVTPGALPPIREQARFFRITG